MTLATESGGVPFACSLFYASDGLDLYFVSETKTRHAQNIAINARVSATISEDHRDWRTIQGIQLCGTCEMLGPIQTVRALALYAEKFPFVASLSAAMAKVKFYKITPQWARLIDNTKGFGFKEEIELKEKT
jgi:uncharacterized protein YhbP (UPF0306 family)